MAKRVADYILERLHAWGVRRIYGYPGDGINGLLGALDRAQERIHFVQARHEEMAAFMACAHAKFTGEVGVCLATSGPGAIHLLNALYDADLDGQPVVAIVGQQKRMSLGGDYQQEVDLPALFKDVAREYVHMATHPAQVRHLIDRAVRIAKSKRAVTCVIVPNDIQELPAVASPPRVHGALFSSTDYCEPLVVPRPEDLARAASVLNAGRKVAILVGAGALHATDEVIEVADLLGAGVAKALLGKAALPDDLPFVTGAIGLLGTKPSWDMMNGCDTLLMIGSDFPYAEFLPKEGQARGVQIDLDPAKLGMRFPTEVNLVGDAKATLRFLKPLLSRKHERGWRQEIERGVADWWRVLEGRAMSSADPINPQRVYWELSAKLPDDCIVTADSGSGTNWYARDLKFRRGMMGSLSGGLATMGPGVPYAIAAKFAFPERAVIATVGDGAMQMGGLAELITVQKYWREWRDPTWVVVVLNNRDLNQVTWEQRALAGDPKAEITQTIPDFPYAQYAEMIGLKGVRVDAPEQLAGAFEQALHAGRPCLVEAIVDPAVPPLPPHITFDQAGKYLSALWKGDPEAMAVVTQSAKEWLQQTIPRPVGRR